MLNFIYSLFGISMAVWYGAIRWTWFADKIKYPWAYAPINLVTAMLSIVFVFSTLKLPFFDMPKINTHWLIVLAVFLAGRNFYYTLEDISDLIAGYPTNFAKQATFIVIDIIMMVYCLMFLWGRGND